MKRSWALIAALGLATVTLMAIVAMSGNAVVAEENEMRKRDGLLDLPLLPLKQLLAVGDQIPNTWSVTFQEGSPIAAIAADVETLSSCTIQASFADQGILSITCPPLSLGTLLGLTSVLTYGLSYEPELRWTALQTQSNAPWGLDRTDQRNLPLSGTYNGAGYDGTGVDAHVLDTGIFAGHSEFGSRVQPGYDAVQDGSATTTDCQGHGTHVAGTIGGTTSGFAKNVNLYASRVLGCDGSGSTSGIVAAIRWVASQNTGRRKVINMSLGGGISTGLDNAVADATSRGVVVVVAAGNENQDACNVSPARAPSAITVMASDRSDARASFSNYGNCSDIIAPGVNIVSASNSNPTGRVTMSGTSMASPHVAGVAALVLQAYPSYSVAQVRNYLVSTSTSGKVTGLPNQSPNQLLFWGAPAQTTATSTAATSSRASTSTSTPPATSASGGTTQRGSVTQGNTVYEPDGSSYSSSSAGVHSATLVGPSGSNFDLYLYKKPSLGSWTLVASNEAATSTKTLSYNDGGSLLGAQFMYAIRAYQGSGSYTLTYYKP